MKCNIVSILFLVPLIIYNVAGLEHENIVGGELAAKKQFEYVVSLQIATIHCCGGALVAADKVLTSAHCFIEETNGEFQNEPWMVVAGTTDVTERVYSSPVDKVYIHAKYNPENYNKLYYDIAVAKLNKSFDVSQTSPINLVSLPIDGETFTENLATIIGFGMDKVEIVQDVLTGQDVPNYSTSGILKYARVITLDDLNDVKKTYFQGKMVQHAELKPEGTCIGDSGSPLVLKIGTQIKVIGVMSGGFHSDKCDERNIPTMYAKVSKFESFVRNAMSDNPGRDTRVETVSSMIFRWPVIFGAEKIITTSRELQAEAIKFKDMAKDMVEVEKKLDELYREADKLKNECELLQLACQLGTEQLNDYYAKNKEYYDKIAEYNETADKLTTLKYLKQDSYLRLEQLKISELYYEL